MTRTEYDNARKAKVAEYRAAGTFAPRRPRRSHYTTTQVESSVREDLGAMRTQIEHQRHVKTDPDWDFDSETAAATRPNKRQMRIVQPSAAQQLAHAVGILDP